MFEKLGYLTVGLLAGALAYFFLGPKVVVEPVAWQGTIKPVEKQISVEIPVSYNEMMFSDVGLGNGKAMLTTDYILLFGVEFPDGWTFKTEKKQDGVVEITVPKLSLLNEIFTEVRPYNNAICNSPTGVQTRDIEDRFKVNAKKAFKERASTILRENKNVYELSRRSLEKSYLKILNSVNKENPALVVNVKFENEPNFN